MAKKSGVSDVTVTKVLGTYAGLVHRVLTDPRRWLGLDDDPPPSAPVPLKILDAVRDRAFGKTTPASPRWSELPVQKRVNWWLRRIAVSAGLAAAAPRLAGALADRIPLQAALSVSSTGLAVCATAREHGVTAAQAWVPLLAAVLFDRDLAPRQVPVPGSAKADAALAAALPAAQPGKHASTGGLGGGALRAAGTVWHLARGFREVSSLLDERPHGLLLWRVVGKLPVVGVAGGWLDERGGIRRASKRTAKLLRQ